MTEEKTLGDLAIAAYCAVLDEGTDSMNVASDLEDHEIRGLRAAASAVREKVIEECATLRNCGPIGSDGPACSVCARCIAEVRASQNEFLREANARLRSIIQRRLDCDGSNGIWNAKLHFDLTKEMRDALHGDPQLVQDGKIP